MQIVLNGQDRVLSELPEKSSIVELISALGLKGDRVAIERNGDIVSRSEWAQTHVLSGDKFEIVHFVGGGAGFNTQKA